MTDEELRDELARLVVKALGVGSRKREWDVIDDLFAAFGVRFADVAASVSGADADNAGTLAEVAATRLAAAQCHLA